MTNKQSISYRIFHSTLVMGSAHAFVILFNLLKNKAAAFILGAEGIGLIALLSSVIDLVKSFCSFGLEQSAVREMGCSEENKLSTIGIIRKWSLLSSIAGALVCIVFSRQLSRFAFGNIEHSLEIMLLSVPVFISLFVSGRLSIIKGLGNYKKTATYNSFSSLATLILSVILYYFLGTTGIILSFIAAAVASLIISSISYQQCVDKKLKVSTPTSLKEGYPMIKLGLFTVFSAISYSTTLFIARSFINSKDSLSSIGIFQAAFTITIMYSALILQSLSSEYFPRLSSVSYSRRKMRYYANSQISTMTLIALPMLSLMIFLAPLIIRILYTIEFSESVYLLQAHLFGVLFRIFSMPIAYLLLVEKRGLLYMFTEISWGIVYFLSMFFLWKDYGLMSTGYAYIISYIYYFLILIVSTRLSSQFTLSSKTIKRTTLTTIALLASIIIMMLINERLIGFLFSKF